jgi:hypothetical protein
MQSSGDGGTRTKSTGAATTTGGSSGFGEGIPDGGPGGACLRDADCGICGWVCNWSRGRICVPSMEGDPGHCASDADCSCPGQACSNGTCSPPANPQCGCNSDCPAGQVCDQLLFTCHTQNAVSCGSAPYHGWDYGSVTTGPSCGCGFICAGGSAAYCQTQCFFFPPECSSDMDCGACNWGWICAPDRTADGGTALKFCQPADGGGWCHDAKDASPVFDAGVLLGCALPDGGG